MDAYSEYMGKYRYSASHKWYIDAILAKGVESLKVKTRFRPVVTGRYLMYNYLTAIGYKAPVIAQIYNVDRTTVLHGNTQVAEMLTSKFDNDIKQAYIIFKGLLN
jgi:hypothetical protein